MSESPVDDDRHNDDDAPMQDDEGREQEVGANITDDDLSDISDIDEEGDVDFDINKIEVPEDIDADNLKAIKGSKRERKEGEGARKERKKGRKERQLEKKSRRRRGEDDEVTADGQTLEGGRRRHKAAKEGEGEKRSRQVRQETPDEALSDGERRRRQLQRNVERILKKPKVRRRRHGVDDLENPMEEEIQILRDRMADAARLDSEARKADPPQPATHKLKMLPQVTAMLNRTGREAESVLVDPEINFMETVKFFLEPLEDGSLPAYNIQRDIFAALMRLRMPKESLVSSGIGKVILFYTKSKRPEHQIKLQSERLLAEWTRPILKRSDDYRKRMLQEVEYDPAEAEATRKRNAIATTSGATASADRAEADARARAKALARPSNRARIESTEIKQYTIVPKSNLISSQRR